LICPRSNTPRTPLNEKGGIGWKDEKRLENIGICGGKGKGMGKWKERVWVIWTIRPPLDRPSGLTAIRSVQLINQSMV